MSGPCTGCGATGYQPSYGGPSICPACDSGAPAARSELKALHDQIAQDNEARAFITKACHEAQDLAAAAQEQLAAIRASHQRLKEALQSMLDHFKLADASPGQWDAIKAAQTALKEAS